MKSILLKSLFVFFVSTSVMAQDWNTIETFVPSSTLKDIYWVNESTAYVVGSMYNGTALNVKKTLDGGETWEEQYTGNESMNYYEIASPNNGEDIFIVGNYGTLIHTNDGGTNWTNIDVGTTEHMRDIFFLSESIGYICADEATILKTIDGGMTWSNLDAEIIGVNSINKIYFINENRGFIPGFNFMHETFDGGLTWSYVPGFEPVAGGLFQIQDIQFVNENVGYISGDQGLLYKTTDGGATWIDKQVDIDDYVVESLMSINFLDSDPTIGFACGYHGLLLRTFDAGETWELMSSDVPGTNSSDGALFHSLDFFGNIGLMVGQGGRVLEYEYITSAVEEVDRANLEINVFPNPVESQLYFTGNKNNINEVRVINMNGEVCKIINNPLNNSISCDELPRGNYILQITSGKIISSVYFIKD